MKIESQQLDFSDVLIKPKRSTLKSRKDLVLTRKFKGFHNKDIEFECVPIMVANMSNITTWKMAEVILKNNMMIAMDKFKTLNDWTEEHATLVHNYPYQLIYTIGIRNGEYETFKEVEKYLPIKTIMVDIPNGYIEDFPKFISKIRSDYPELFIYAGNVVSGEMVQELLLAGADAVKCGIGSGAMCDTRIKTGVGRPQLSTIMDCSDASHGIGGYVISDGGIRTVGDFGKAFGGGADFVMAGTFFAGTDETEGEVQDEDRPYKINYGMSSDHAMKKHYGNKANYKTSEGLVAKIPYKGSVQNVIEDILGGLRSTGTYIGARKIKDFPKCTTFYLVNRIVEHNFKEIEI